MQRASLLSSVLFLTIACSGPADSDSEDPTGVSGVGGSEDSASGGAFTGGSGSGATGGFIMDRAAGGTGGETSTSLDGGSKVMSWVPPYYIDAAQEALQADFGGMGMADGLSFLGLQFWRTNGGSTELDTATPDDVTWFVNWGHSNGVGVLLCVHNHVGGDWNWPAAVNSFQTNRAAFVTHLLAEVDKYDLDGIDLDLEGIVDATAGEQEAYRSLAQDLANGLHPKGKVVHVASFHGQWNAPNWNWWPDLLPIVDGIETMGYDQSGMNVDYATLVEHASSAPSKLLIGVPSWVGSWQGNTASEQLGWLVDQGQVGVAIWDATLANSDWRQASIWQQLATVKAR